MPLIDGHLEPLKLPDKISRVLTDTSRPWEYRGLWGGRNGAKDWSATGIVNEFAVRTPKRVLWTREVQRTIKDSVYQLLCDQITRQGYQQYFDIKRDEITGYNGSKYIFTGLTDVNSADIKSMEAIDIVVIGEAQSLTEKTFRDLDPTIRKVGAEIWFIFNTQSGHEFSYQFCVVNPPDSLIGGHVNYLDLPPEWIAPRILAQASRMKETNPTLYGHIWLGEPGGGGQFFPEFGDHLKEQPYDIQPHECNLYGSIDYGDGQGENAGATSFGLRHIDREGRPHRLFTYYKRHQDAVTYAREIVAAIQSFPHTQGVMPKITWADPSMFIKRERIDNKDPIASKSVADIFKEHGLTLTPANNDRVNGWRVCRHYYCVDETGVPRSFYWDGYNDEYEQYIPTLTAKEKNPDDCEKGGEDHVGDEDRYFMVKCMGIKSSSMVGKVAKKRDMVKTLRQFNKAHKYSPTGVR